MKLRNLYWIFVGIFFIAVPVIVLYVILFLK